MPRRAGTVIHTPQTLSCCDTVGAGATAARTSCHTQHALGQRVLATGAIQLSETPPALGGGMLGSPPTPLTLQGFPWGQRQPQPSCSGTSPHQHRILPSPPAPATSLKEDPEGAPDTRILWASTLKTLLWRALEQIPCRAHQRKKQVVKSGNL